MATFCYHFNILCSLNFDTTKTIYQSTVCVFSDKIYSEKLTCGRMFGNFQSKLLRAVLVNTTPIPQFTKSSPPAHFETVLKNISLKSDLYQIITFMVKMF